MCKEDFSSTFFHQTAYSLGMCNSYEISSFYNHVYMEKVGCLYYRSQMKVSTDSGSCKQVLKMFRLFENYLYIDSENLCACVVKTLYSVINTRIILCHLTCDNY